MRSSANHILGQQVHTSPAGEPDGTSASAPPSCCMDMRSASASSGSSSPSSSIAAEVMGVVVGAVAAYACMTEAYQCNANTCTTLLYGPTLNETNASTY